MMKSAFKIFLLGVLAMFLLITPALAANTDKFTITKVLVDDYEAEDDVPIYIERGSTAEVKVFFEWNDTLDDVRVDASINGYEYGDVEKESEMFDLESDEGKRAVTLNLDIPEDMDASDHYTLHVEVSGKHDYYEKEYELWLEEKRHSLNVQDIILTPKSIIKAGHLLSVNVRVENLGDQDEEDIKITARIPKLGVSARTWIDELVVEEVEGDDDEDTLTSDKLALRIPYDAPADVYDVIVDVEYDRNHRTISETMTIKVEATDAVVAEEMPDNTIVNFDLSEKALENGKEQTYKVMIANINDEAKVYSLEVDGTKLWATTRLDPPFLSIEPDRTGQLYVYVTPNEDAEKSKQVFTIKLKAGDEIVHERNLEADLGAEETDEGTTADDDAGTFQSVGRALLIGMGFLILVLGILGLIVLYNRRETKEEEAEDDELPTSSDGKAYY